jgi:hypothetical protein
MNAAEIIRNLTNVVDRGTAQPTQQTKPESEVQTQDIRVNNTDNTEKTVMVPPLQQKLELMKKAAGVDNIYDEAGEADPLDQMKKMAGIQVVAQADEDAGE